MRSLVSILIFIFCSIGWSAVQYQSMEFKKDVHVDSAVTITAPTNTSIVLDGNNDAAAVVQRGTNSGALIIGGGDQIDPEFFNPLNAASLILAGNNTTDPYYTGDYEGNAIILLGGGPGTPSPNAEFRITDANFQELFHFTAQGNAYFADQGALYLQLNGPTGGASTAVMELDSTTQGFLPPVMNTTQKNAIVSPLSGLFLYDSVLNKPSVYNGASWSNLFGSADIVPIVNGGTNASFLTSGSVLFYDGSKVSESNSNLFWDKFAKLLNIHSSSSGATAIQASGAIISNGSVQGANLILSASGGGTLSNNASAATTTYSLTWPGTQASGTKCLVNDGAGKLSWAACTSGGSSFTTTQIYLTGTPSLGSAGSNKILSWPTTTINNGGSDITYARDTTNGDTFTINTAGTYYISADSDGGGIVVGISVNASSLTTSINGSLSYANGMRGVNRGGYNMEQTLDLSVNDVVRIHTDGGSIGGTANYTFMNIIRIH